MEKIPLRAYNREIEQLIDNDRSNDALEHCQLVLDQYPRCLDTLRLMGKAYLELRFFDKAEDIFQKVLSYMPDDFTANLGMSLLREKQTNLEGTIWHMERAYEAQPSNTAVQSELRRLYKQRDGIDSPRIRLTRGALVRMYIRGDLIPQAVNEIQSILNEDPSRMDIKILQATATLKAGKKDEAIQLCQEILNDLPYCYDANRLLFENRASSLKIEEAQTVQQHLRELDPYYEFTSPELPDPAKVPEGEVKIEVAGENGPKTATGVPSQNLSFAEYNAFNQAYSAAGSGTLEKVNEQQISGQSAFKNEEKKPAWMEDIQTPSFQNIEANSNADNAADKTAVTPTHGFDTGKPMTTEDSFPQNEHPDEKGGVPFSVPEDSQAPANPFLAVPGDSIPTAEPGDIPEWLRALASEPPAASSDAVTSPLRVPGETGVLQTGEENLDFLRNLPGEGAESKKDNFQPEVNPANSVVSLSDILPPSPFLTSNETTQPVPIEEGGENIQPPSREIPGWLRSAVEPSAEPSADSDFRQDFTSDNLPPLESFADSVAIENQYQAPNPENIGTAPVSEKEIPTPEIEQYLEQLRKDISPGEQPEWLKKENLGNELEALFEDKSKPAVSAPAPAPIPEPEPESESVQPDWMAQLRQDEEVPPQQTTTPETPASVPNVPDWLFTPEDSEGETAPIQSDTPVTHQPPPDWLAAARPDIFARDFDQQDAGLDTTGVTESIKNEEAVTPEPYDFGAEFGQPAKSESITPEPDRSETVLPDLGFLQSQPIDFMAADREPLEDNLESSTLPSSAKEELDFSKAVPAESLPADLAALLREESVNEITTNPLEIEPVPGISLELNIPELTPQDSDSAFRSGLSGQEKAESEEIPSSENLEISGLFAQSTDFSAEALQTEINSQLAGLFNTTEQPASADQVIPEVELSLQPDQPVDTAKADEQPPQPGGISQPVAEFTHIDEPVQPEPDVSFEQNVTLPVNQGVPEVQFSSVHSNQMLPVEAIAAEAPEEKPKAAPAKEKPVTLEPKTAKPARPISVSKPVIRHEKPVQTSTAIQRKNAGSADLTRAREAASHGDLQTALRRYIKLINSNKVLEFVSGDLKDIVKKNPKNYLAWQTYGDARLRSNRIQEALDAYAKAAELLK